MMDPTEALLVLSRTATPTPDPATVPPADPYVGFLALTTEGIAAPTFREKATFKQWRRTVNEKKGG
jgi:hypothetical protein